MENFKEFEIENQQVVVGGYNFQEVVVGGYIVIDIDSVELDDTTPNA